MVGVGPGLTLERGLELEGVLEGRRRGGLERPLRARDRAGRERSEASREGPSFKTSDYLDTRAKASMDLAAVLRLAQRFTEAAAAITNAIRLYEQKGNTVSAKTARDLLRTRTP